MEKYDVRINFNNFTCYVNELNEYINSINFVGCKENEILYYESGSLQACYNFRIFVANHDEKIIELIAIPA